MSGKLKLSGDLSKALALESVMKASRADFEWLYRRGSARRPSCLLTRIWQKNNYTYFCTSGDLDLETDIYRYAVDTYVYESLRIVDLEISMPRTKSYDGFSNNCCCSLTGHVKLSKFNILCKAPTTLPRNSYIF
jgi:hypothetical protein